MNYLGSVKVKSRIFPFLSVILISIIILLGGCVVNTSNIQGFNIISIDEEKTMGNKFSSEIEKQYKVVTDPEINAYVSDMGKRLLSGAREVKFEYRFKVVQDPTLNAFAVPGGHLYIHTGLIKSARNEHELAGVLAHEINHVVARHGTRQITQEYGYGLVLQLVLGQNPGMVTQIAANLFGKVGSLSYSRGMETQADLLAIETLVKSGYDPNGLLSFFSTLQNTTNESPGKLAKYFSSHPPTSERIREVKAEIEKQPSGSRPIENPNQFRRIQARVI